jgi:phage/plasmid-associated DNA primase
MQAPSLYKDYLEWAAKNGIKKPLYKLAFTNRLLEKGFDRKKGHGNIWTWLGIDVKGPFN